MVPVLIAVVIAAVAGILIVRIRARLNKLQSDFTNLSQQHDQLHQRFSGVLDAEAERERVRGEQAVELQTHINTLASLTSQSAAERDRIRNEQAAELQTHSEALAGIGSQQKQRTQELIAIEARIAELSTELNALDEEANLQAFGFYEPRYDFATSEQYEARLKEILGQQKQMIKLETAAIGKVEWTVNGNKAEGRKQIKQTLRLMLRAFNGECDAAIGRVKFNNIGVMEARIHKAHEAINGLVQVQQCEITSGYLDLKLQELYLAHEYQEKIQAEREEQRQIKEQMREEERALRELEKARQDAEKEERRYEDALARARQEAEQAVGAKQDELRNQIELLQQKLADAQATKERAISQAQMTRSGHVYIISNIGSFGENVYKIGMTRRLEPMDRIHELSDASVPFDFDVHAIIYTDDAPTLESTLHREFHRRRVNRINMRKEFFSVDIEEIATVVTRHHGEIELTRTAEAKHYRATRSMIEAEANGEEITA